MKKPYAFSITGILILMIFSIGLYAYKIIKENDMNINSFILNSICWSSLDCGINKNEQNQLYDYLSQHPDVQSKTVKTAIVTTTCYDELSTNSERKCYNLIKFQCNKILDTKSKDNLYPIVPLTIPETRLNITQIKKIIYAIQNDNPDIFWIASTFSYQYSGNNTILKLNSIFPKEKQQNSAKKLAEKVNEILSRIPKNLTEYEIELFFHDYIIDNCKYKKTTEINSLPQEVFTSYGCLIENSAVCEGFSKSMQLLMNSAGIKCRTITGARNSEPHMWNVARINGNWYHVDVTWDNAGEFQKYNYFNVTDEVIKKDHTINDQLNSTTKFDENKRYNFKLPICTEISENYYEKNAFKIKKLDTENDNLLTKKLITAALRKKSYFYIMVDKNLKFESIKNYLFNEKTHKFFSYINTANKSLKDNQKINNQQAKYAENTFQNVLIIQLFYK